MDTGLLRALFLLCVLFYVAWRWHARVCERRLPHLAEPGTQQPSAEHLAALFRQRRLYRLGVLGFCLLALGVYYLGLPRLAAMALLGCAGFCQYGVWRARTSHLFPSAPQAQADAPAHETARPATATAEDAGKHSATAQPVRTLSM